MSCYRPSPDVVALKAVYTDAEIALITPAFPSQIYNYASEVVTTGDGVERALAAEVMCHAAERWPSWPVSQRKGHAVATVDDALLALSVGLQDMRASVRLLASPRSTICDHLAQLSGKQVSADCPCTADIQVGRSNSLACPTSQPAGQLHFRVVSTTPDLSFSSYR